jgi:hypothetical protein
MEIKLAEALLRRKELQAKVDQLHRIKDTDMVYQLRSKRIKVNEGFDDLDADFPKLTVGQVTAEYDHYSRQLRLIDGKIQHTNWTATIDCPECMTDYVPPQA